MYCWNQFETVSSLLENKNTIPIYIYDRFWFQIGQHCSWSINCEAIRPTISFGIGMVSWPPIFTNSPNSWFSFSARCWSQAILRTLSGRDQMPKISYLCNSISPRAYAILALNNVYPSFWFKEQLKSCKGMFYEARSIVYSKIKVS